MFTILPRAVTVPFREAVSAYPATDSIGRAFDRPDRREREGATYLASTGVLALVASPALPGGGANEGEVARDGSSRPDLA
jgi:hypothetical protein